ncbi:hypothetical protein [Actinoplanes sp. NPDC051411]
MIGIVKALVGLPTRAAPARTGARRGRLPVADMLLAVDDERSGR